MMMENIQASKKMNMRNMRKNIKIVAHETNAV